jgi:hypothetical protein
MRARIRAAWKIQAKPIETKAAQSVSQTSSKSASCGAANKESPQTSFYVYRTVVFEIARGLPGIADHGPAERMINSAIHRLSTRLE